MNNISPFCVPVFGILVISVPSFLTNIFVTCKQKFSDPALSATPADLLVASMADRFLITYYNGV